MSDTLPLLHRISSFCSYSNVHCKNGTNHQTTKKNLFVLTMHVKLLQIFSLIFVLWTVAGMVINFGRSPANLGGDCCRYRLKVNPLAQEIWFHWDVDSVKVSQPPLIMYKMGYISTFLCSYRPLNWVVLDARRESVASTVSRNKNANEFGYGNKVMLRRSGKSKVFFYVNKWAR